MGSISSCNIGKDWWKGGQHQLLQYWKGLVERWAASALALLEMAGEEVGISSCNLEEVKVFYGGEGRFFDTLNMQF